MSQTLSCSDAVHASAAPHLVVHGGVALSSQIVPSANKNAVLPILCATLLTRHPVRLRAVPDITDVRKILALFEQLGSAVQMDFKCGVLSFHHRHTQFDAARHRLPREMRSSIMLVPPLLARFGAARIENDVTGCTLGVRRSIRISKCCSGLVVRSSAATTHCSFAAGALCRPLSIGWITHPLPPPKISFFAQSGPAGHRH